MRLYFFSSLPCVHGAYLLAYLILSVSAPAAGPPGRLTDITVDPSGEVRLAISASDPFQTSALVERSPDLRNWTPFSMVSLWAGEETVIDSEPLSHTGFYRIAPLPPDYRGDSTISFEAASSCLTVPEDTPTVSLTVRRQGPLEGLLEILWSLVPVLSTPGEDYVDETGMVSFPPGADRATITLQLRDDPTIETDEAVLVVLEPPEGLVTLEGTAAVVLADDDAPVRTELICEGLGFLKFLDGRFYSSGSPDSALLSWESGAWTPYPEAYSLRPIAGLAASGPYLLRIEELSQHGTLVRTSHDGSDRLVLVPDLRFARAPGPLAASERAVFYVENQWSPDIYFLRRVPLNGGPVETLLTLQNLSPVGPISSLLPAGPYLWFTKEPELFKSELWRMPQDGGEPEKWTGNEFGSARGRLLRDDRFLYQAYRDLRTNRIVRISPLDRSVKILWEEEDDDPFDLWAKAPVDLALAGGNLYWLDKTTLRTLPVSGGTPGTLVRYLENPTSLAAGSRQVVWTEQEGAHSYDLTSETVTTLQDTMASARDVVTSGDAFWYATGARSFPGDANVRYVRPGEKESVSVAASASSTGFSHAVGLMTAGGGHVYVAESQGFKRLRQGSQPPEFIWGGNWIDGMAADDQSVYWMTNLVIRALDHTGGEPRIVAHKWGGPSYGLQVEGNRLFWVDELEALRSVPISGGSPTDLLTGYVRDFVVDSNHVFAAFYPPQGGGQIVRMDHDGGSPVVIEWLPNPSFPSHIAQTEDLILFSKTSVGHHIHSIPKMGGTTATIAGGLPEAASALTTDGNRVYWLEPLAGRVRSAPLPP